MSWGTRRMISPLRALISCGVMRPCSAHPPPAALPNRSSQGPRSCRRRARASEQAPAPGPSRSSRASR
eukprot:6335386-Pyramimonas_sp.AAC.1